MRIILVLAGLAVLGFGEEVEAGPAWRDSVVADGLWLGRVTERVVTAPLRASAQDWVIAGGVAAGIGLSALLDHDVRREAARLDDGWYGTVDDIGHTFQQTELFLATAGALYIGGYGLQRPALTRVGQELAVAFVIAAAGTQVVKHAAGRTRPDQNAGPEDFVGPTLDDNHQSLWSGDVMKAFVLASVLSEEIRHPAATALFYGLASATAFQRIHTDRHWFSDVLSSAVWSTAVGIGTVRIGNQKSGAGSPAASGLRVRVAPGGIEVHW